MKIHSYINIVPFITTIYKIQTKIYTHILHFLTIQHTRATIYTTILYISTFYYYIHILLNCNISTILFLYSPRCVLIRCCGEVSVCNPCPAKALVYQYLLTSWQLPSKGSTCCNIILQPTSTFSQWSLTFWISHQFLCSFHLSPMHATCSAHIILLDLIILVIFGEEYNLRNFFSYTSLLVPIISSRLCTYT